MGWMLYDRGYLNLNEALFSIYCMEDYIAGVYKGSKLSRESALIEVVGYLTRDLGCL